MEFAEVRKYLIERLEEIGKRVSKSGGELVSPIEVLSSKTGVSEERIQELTDIMSKELNKVVEGEINGTEYIANCLRYVRNENELVYVLIAGVYKLVMLSLATMNFADVAMIVSGFVADCICSSIAEDGKGRMVM